MKYRATKTWGAETGLSCAFRQWRADSHCRFLHGYAICVRIVFEADELDDRNWVYDFGNTKWIKETLVDLFDHKTVIAEDDPEIDAFQLMDQAGIIQLRILPHVGCEKFAEWIFEDIADAVKSESNGRVQVVSVEVFEHGANSAEVIG